jgi:hypothetical protein
MPLTALQRRVLALLASHRTPESHAGGGAVINGSEQAPRFSSDLEVFHDTEESVRICAERDAQVLTAAGFDVEWLVRAQYLYQARIAGDGETLGLDWCHDSAFPCAGNAVTPDPNSPEFPHLVRHFGSVRGAWPRLTEAR